MFNKKYVKDYIDIINSDVNKHYNEFLKLKDAVSKSDAVFKGVPVPHTYQGLFYDLEDKKNLQEYTNILMSITRKVVNEYVNNPKYRELFSFSKELEELILHKPLIDIAVPIARYDLFYNGGDDFKFCEFNTDGSSAMNEDNTIGNLMLNTLAMKEFSKKYELENIELFRPWVEKSTKLYMDKFSEKPNVAIVDFLEIGTSYEFKKFKRVYEEMGFNCEIVDVRDIKFKNGKIYKDDYRIDLIYRRFVSTEFMKRYEEVSEFIKAYLSNSFMMLGSFRSQIMHSKIIFKVLRDDMTKNIVTDKEYEFLKKHIPFTDWLREDVFDEIINNKNKYILKPVDDYSSRGVYAGYSFNTSNWKDIVKKSLNSNYIYQEYFKVDPLVFADFDSSGKLLKSEFNSVLGMFIYNEEFIAPYTRFGKLPIVGGKNNYFTAPNFLIKKEK